MDEATLARAVEPFFTTKGPGKGTGLGLSMVHGLAEQSGGYFTLKSRLGEGTTAELWLPADAGAASATGQSRLPSPLAERQAPLVVLAVDDDDLVLTNTVAMLEDLGHTAIAASSGSAALDILRHDDCIDLVITDQVMPDMTGLQLAEAIKVDRPELPIILATGFAEIPAQVPGVTRLSKPFTQAELAEKVRDLRAMPGQARVLKFPGNRSG
jgi:CheY-like chemotaxis protein